MNEANHSLTPYSTFPFAIFQNGCGEIDISKTEQQSRGNIVVGNDVWIGRDATIMPDVNIGDGAIIGANAVVAKDVAPYEIVVGNPAGALRKRFNQETFDILLKVRWWDWPKEIITRNLDAITQADLDGMRNAV